ncbi:MAG: serine/threonine-protein kinase [Gemmatimonadota bacterium]
METILDSVGSALLPRYVVEREIGRGAMAVVLLARDTKHDRPVAIKVLSPELTDAIGAQRFGREIEVVAGLNHPHILPLHDSGAAAGFLYYVMPYVGGGSLRHRIEREGRLPNADAVRIVREVADALGFAHRHGVIHRDVKPGNILLSEGHALLADFGIAHLVSGVKETLTGSGLALGTPTYVSPEQASGDRQLDGRADIYSLGCVLFESLTGAPPFTDTNVRALLTRHIVDVPPRLRSLRADVSEGVEAVVETALQKDPDDRFQTGEQMAGALDLVTGSSGGFPAVVLRRLGVPRRHVRKVRRALAAVGLLLAIGGFFGVRAWLDRDAGLPRAEVRYLILPLEDDELSERAAGNLREQLTGWSSVSVVQKPALEGPTVDLKVAGVVSPLAFGASLASRLDADYTVYVEARDFEDSVRVNATVYEPPSQIERDVIPARGMLDSLDAVTAEIALKLLGVRGQGVELPSLLSRSADHLAHQEFQSGRDALWAWRLAEAHRRFQAAIDRDSTFALAHFLLAETMYWEIARDKDRLRELGHVIEHHSRRADRLGTDDRLRPQERKAVDAFRAFWTGDYELARSRYDGLLAFEPYDLEALVLRGAVEFEDLMTAPGEDGRPWPRQDLNVARALFDSASALNAQWELSWGHLHEIDRTLADAAQGSCILFEPPGEEHVPPYVVRQAAEQVSFCPVVEAGAIRWIPTEEFTRPVDVAYVRAADEVRRRTTRRLDEYALTERDQPRHREELAKFLLSELAAMACNADPRRTDSLVAAARQNLERALELRGDTTPQDRAALAVLRLGTGDLDGALAGADRALGELVGWESRDGPAPPLAAANVYLAAGRAHPSIELADRVWSENTMAVRDPEDERRRIDVGGRYATLWSLAALGALGLSGPEVTRRFDDLHRAWRAEKYSDRDRVVLRYETLGGFAGVEPALVHAPDEWDEWFAGFEEERLDLPAVWKGVFAAAENPPDTAAARRHLDEAIRQLEDPDRRRKLRAEEYYVPIVLAERIGADSIAAGLRARAGSCALRLDNFDPGWAMRHSLGLED